MHHLREDEVRGRRRAPRLGVEKGSELDLGQQSGHDAEVCAEPLPTGEVDGLYTRATAAARRSRVGSRIRAWLRAGRRLRGRLGVVAAWLDHRLALAREAHLHPEGR